MPDETLTIAIPEIRSLAMDACLACGASSSVAQSLVDATISAACEGTRDLGFPHLMDYLARFRSGGINGQARPKIQHPLPALIQVDADGGIAQLGFDLIFEDYVKRIRAFGVVTFTQKNSFTAGELGYYVRRLAAEGILSIAVANGPALMTVQGSRRKIFCTNPIAFAAPAGPGRRPVVIDQASSATAFVKLRSAADEKRSIPDSWALDGNGQPTTDASEAIKGALLPFGGYKGANMALMVELLAAGLSGAAWSMDGDDFIDETRRIDAGLTVIGMAPIDAVGFAERLDMYASRLEDDGVHVPGRKRDRPLSAHVTVPLALVEKLKHLSLSTPPDR